MLLLSPVAAADEGETTEEDPLSPYRTPFDVLAERAIGTTSVPVEFNWRRTKVQLAGFGNHYFELNNFNSVRAGGMARIPTSGLILELGLGYVWVWDSPSSELLALTPYRQPGRPSRTELDVAVGVPIAEGAVTTFPRAFPAVQMVLNAYVGFRYLFYPRSLSGLRAREVAGALLSPTLSTTEIDNLEKRRLDAMQIDPARYGIMAGLGNDLYFRQGMFVSPRVMFALPLAAPATETDLLFWVDISVAVGVAL
jgi:hypothetical protein